MNVATAVKIENSFLSFYEKIQPAVEIKTDKDYQFSLELLEQLMNKAEDREGEPLLHLIDIVSASIEAYENSLESIQSYVQQTDSIDPGVSVLRVLIDQYNLTYKDLESEIGSKSLISQILKGTKNLTRDHIANLSRRFNISTQLFF